LISKLSEIRQNRERDTLFRLHTSVPTSHEKTCCLIFRVVFRLLSRKFQNVQGVIIFASSTPVISLVEEKGRLLVLLYFPDEKENLHSEDRNFYTKNVFPEVQSEQRCVGAVPK